MKRKINMPFMLFALACTIVFVYLVYFYDTKNIQDLVFGIFMLLIDIYCFLFIVRLMLFQPHKYKIGRWYIFRFSKQYKTTKFIFDEFVDLHKACGNDVAIFLQKIENFGGFKRRSSTDSDADGLGKLSVDDLLSADTIQFTGHQSYIWSCRGITGFYTVYLLFNLNDEDDMYLQRMCFYYAEENSISSFQYIFDDMYFNPPPKGGSLPIPEPDPVLVDAL